ncbi:host cell division inhibitor Icd-like protein [Escherichia coli O88:H38]|uniref:host cell division inhibitor Icd-like protein n=1 Tax=Shigella boydii TaxID=621 RepID=UPI00112F5B73|nr:host cell division inhibitor Icd-like protein [Shigella boydii]
MILNEPAAQKEAFNLASLLTNVNPYNLIKPKVANGCLLSIVMVNDLAKLSLNLTKPDIHARGMTTNDDILNQEIITSKKLIAGNKFPPLAGGMNWIATVVNRSASTFETNTRALEDLLGVVTREGEYSESIKKGLPLCGNTVYGYKTPHKTGVGIRTPQAIEAIHDAPASFFVSAHTHTLSMVGCMGLPSGRLVPLIASSPNPVQSTASELRTSGGGYKPSIKEAAAMLATTPTQKPQFIWIIAAVRRDMPTITAKIHHIAAETEQEARRILARDHVCFFAGRIRTGGAHA